MAKRRGNKSKAIREILAVNSSATVKEIQEALALKRVKASVALISKLKSAGNGKTVKRPTKRNGQAEGAGFAQLMAARQLVVATGSMDAAKSALDSFGKLLIK